MSKEQDGIVIDLKTSYSCDKLYSRIVWQKLFDLYRNTGGTLSNMDNMLCDLYTLERNFKAGPFVVYWYFAKSFTVMQDFPDLEETCYKINYNDVAMEVIITEVTEESEVENERE